MGWGDSPASGLKASLGRLFDAWVEAERGRFVLFLPVLMAAGAVFYFTLRTEPGLLQAGLLAGGSIVAAALPQPPVQRAGLLCLGFCAAGFLSGGLATWRAPPWDRLPRIAAVVTGKVTSLDVLPQGRRVTLHDVSLDGGKLLARQVRLRLRDDDALPMAPGDTLRVRALLQPPPPPAYPGGWDLQRDAFFSGMAGYGFAIGDAVRLRASPQARFEALRAAVAARIIAALPGPRGAIAATLLTGLGTAIPAPDRLAFQNSGLAHLLAVAGLHIGIVMGLVFGLMRFLLAALEYPALYWPARRISALSALAAGGAYLALTGGHVPILRSFAMACLMTLAVLTGRRASPMRALALAALLLLAARPDAVMGVSFQMSFAAVLALLAGYEALRPILLRARQGSWRRRFLLYPGLLAVTSFLAGTASLPFAAYHFGRAALFYVPANMVAVPLMAFWVMPCCVASLLLMPFGWQQLALAPAGLGIAGLMAIARAVSSWPDAAPSLPQMPGWGLAVAAAGLAWLGIWRSPWQRLIAILPLLLACASPWLVEAPDVLVTPGAAVIAMRSGSTIFVEAGKRADPFALEAPLRVWGHPPIAFPCHAAACEVSVGHTSMVLARNNAGLDCRGAQLVVSASGLGAGCAAPRLIDPDTIRLTGAVALYTGAGTMRQITDRALRGDRPWVFTDRPSLPPAQTE